jgi:hypothetical protein
MSKEQEEIPPLLVGDIIHIDKATNRRYDGTEHWIIRVDEIIKNDTDTDTWQYMELSNSGYNIDVEFNSKYLIDGKVLYSDGSERCSLNPQSYSFLSTMKGFCNISYIQRKKVKIWTEMK